MSMESGDNEQFQDPSLFELEPMPTESVQQATPEEGMLEGEILPPLGYDSGVYGRHETYVAGVDTGKQDFAALFEGPGEITIEPTPLYDREFTIGKQEGLYRRVGMQPYTVEPSPEEAAHQQELLDEMGLFTDTEVSDVTDRYAKLAEQGLQEALARMHESGQLEKILPIDYTYDQAAPAQAEQAPDETPAETPEPPRDAPTDTGEQQ